MRKIFIIAVMFTMAGIVSCATAPSCLIIAPPAINMTGPKTVIERQIIGDYKELNENSWMVSSVKTFSSEGTSSDKADTQLLAAFADRNKIADNVALYKKEGVLGEANTGYVAYISSNAYENNVSKKAALTDIIKKENTARGTIFKRTLFLSKNVEPTQSEIDAFGKSFAEEQVAKASKGEMVQDKSGAWKKK